MNTYPLTDKDWELVNELSIEKLTKENLAPHFPPDVVSYILFNYQ
jgi:hypothetical protein